MNDSLPTDPLFPLQWHLQNTGQSGGTPGVDLNVVKVWADYDGSGVVVGVVDTGVEPLHPDLAANVDSSLGYDYFRPDNPGTPISANENHGVAVAGLIAAEAGNGVGGTGAAPGATLAPIHLTLDTLPEGVSEEDVLNEIPAAFTYAASHFDVMNNSWGEWGYGVPVPGLAEAMEDAAQNGRGGLGTVMVFASGNERGDGGDANTSQITNSPYSIAVAAVDHNGNPASYSSPGTDVLVAAPSVTKIDGERIGNIVTTDRMGYEGYNAAASPEGDACYDFGGTSASAPEVSGVVALMLEANPELGYRDVQDILALTARDAVPDGDSAVNGATDWNGGGMHVSRDMGFGLVDALAAVRLSETWEEQNTYANLVTASGSATVGQAIPDGQGYAASSIEIEDDIDIERVQVLIDIDHALASDLTVTLVAPSGTESPLLDQAWPDSGQAWPDEMSLTSTFHLGESSQGTWTLYVADAEGNDVTGTLNSWEIEFYGKGASEDSLYVYTNEYSDMATGDPARTILADASGDDVLNVAAVTSGGVVNLNAGTFGLVDATPFVLAAGTAIETVYAGDGDDMLVGDGQDNVLFGGRGNDALAGGLGDDALDGGQSGFDMAVYSGTRLMYALAQTDGATTVSGPEGTDLLRNIDVLAFADGLYSLSALLAPGLGSYAGVLAS